jgi:hypothetical protein
VNSAISSIDSVTHRNAASAQEGARASEELSTQAIALQDQIASLGMLVSIDAAQVRHVDLSPEPEIVLPLAPVSNSTDSKTRSSKSPRLATAETN